MPQESAVDKRGEIPTNVLLADFPGEKFRKRDRGAGTINADTTAHPELLSSRFAYVSVSRARLDAEIYTNNVEELVPRLGADVGKSSALEFSQSLDNVAAKDFGIDQTI